MSAPLIGKMQLVSEFFEAHPIESQKNQMDIVRQAWANQTYTDNTYIQEWYQSFMNKLAADKLSPELLEIILIENQLMLQRLVEADQDAEATLEYFELLQFYRDLLFKVKFDDSVEDKKLIQFLAEFNQTKAQLFISNFTSDSFYAHYMTIRDQQLKRIEDLNAGTALEQNYYVRNQHIIIPLAYIGATLLFTLAIASFVLSLMFLPGAIAIIGLLPYFVLAIAALIPCALVSETNNQINLYTAQVKEQVSLSNKVLDELSESMVKEFKSKLTDENHDEFPELTQVLEAEDPEVAAIDTVIKNKEGDQGLRDTARRKLAFFKSTHPTWHPEYEMPEPAQATI